MILNALRAIFLRSGWKSFLKGRAKSTAESLLMMPNTLAMGFKPWLPFGRADTGAPERARQNPDGFA